MNNSSKADREEFEINGFIAAVQRLPAAKKLDVVRKRERPDYLVRDTRSGELFGVELTAVYLDDSSAPAAHADVSTDAIVTRDDENIVDSCIQRLLGAVSAKIDKARNGYSLEHPLILAICMGRYAGANITRGDLEKMTREHRDVFDAMAPFSRIVVWNLADGGVCEIVPSGDGA